MKFVSLLSALLAATGLTSGAAVDTRSVAQQIHDELSPQLSRQDLISTEDPPRWSSFDAPDPAVVVNVETESDVAVTVSLHSSLRNSHSRMSRRASKLIFLTW